jgi:hydrogenase expression/formation protein HypC
MCLAVPGRIVSTWQTDELPMADVDFDGVRKAICTVTLSGVGPGDWILIHAGFALQRVSGRDAAQLLRWLTDSDALARSDGKAMGATPASAASVSTAGASHDEDAANAGCAPSAFDAKQPT